MKRTVQEHLTTYAAGVGLTVPEVMRLYVRAAGVRASVGALILPKPRKK